MVFPFASLLFPFLPSPSVFPTEFSLSSRHPLTSVHYRVTNLRASTDTVTRNGYLYVFCSRIESANVIK